jgi:drug/metabolite transporter (DMT)-like permease
MPFGLLAGLSAALAWGVLDVLTALGSRVLGSLRVTAWMQLVTAVIFVSLVIVTGTVLPTDSRSLGLAALLGLVGAGGALAYFTGLQFGPISIVAGTVAAFGGLTVVLSVLFRGESLTPLQALGATIGTIGVLLTSVAFGGGIRATRLAGPGVVFALVALVLFALTTIVTDIGLETMSWLQLYTVARVVNSSIGLVVLGLLGVAHHRLAARPDAPGPGSGPIWTSRGAIVAVVAAGVLDVVGDVAFAAGLESAPTWMVGLAASFGPAVTILVAVALLGERLRPIQWLGLAGIAVGLVAIAIP